MPSSSSAAEQPAKAPAAIGSGKAGPVRRALVKALDEARVAGRMTSEHEIRAVVAERLAAVVDRCAARADERELVRSADKLLEVVDTLPVRSAGGADGGERSGGGAAGDSADDGGARLLTLLDSPPSVGDTADA